VRDFFGFICAFIQGGEPSHSTSQGRVCHWDFVDSGVRFVDLVYVYYNLRLWVKQFEIKIDAKAISLDGIDTTAAWRVEVEEHIIDTTLDWLEDSGDDHGISEDLDQDVP
jgi:hypothetical protein